jgi:hypothetical protein
LAFPKAKSEHKRGFYVELNAKNSTELKVQLTDSQGSSNETKLEKSAYKPS